MPDNSLTGKNRFNEGINEPLYFFRDSAGNELGKYCGYIILYKSSCNTSRLLTIYCKG